MKKVIFLILLTILSINYFYAQCFDMTNLRSPGVVCTYGSYSNPYKNVGVVDDGASASTSRHTVNTDVYATDPNVPSLKVVPTGESSSIRLGNWRTGSEAESVTFEYVVDVDNPILLLKYAAVMENPGHTPSAQPRLTLKVYDKNSALVNPDCMSFDFISSESLGWNSLDGGGLLWKDWTFIGVDLSSYIGQRLKIQITNYDCDHSGHYGYSYFHLSCKEKKIKSLICGAAEHTTFSAPAGFEYTWYYFNGNKRVEKGSGQTVTVPIDGTEYFCDIHQVGNSSCSYTLSAIANPRYPIAEFSIRQVSKCVDTLYLTNLSGVSMDGRVKNNPHENCDEAEWDLGDGRKLNDYDISKTPIAYAVGGMYTIKLTVKLTDGNCIDAYSKTVYVRGYEDVYEAEIEASICEGDYYFFGGERLTKEGVYYKVNMNRFGCDSTTKLLLTVRPSYLYEDTIYFCENEVYNYKGLNVVRAGTYYQRYISVLGCDSVYKLTAFTIPAPVVRDTVYICENDSFYLNGRFVKDRGIYIDTLKSVLGCDSICQTLLQHRPTFLFEEKATICKNETYLFQDVEYNKPGVYYHDYASVYGCDSIYKLTLDVLPSYLIPVYAEVCHDQKFYFRGRELSEPGIYYDSLYTELGCDSVYMLVLNKTPIYMIEDTVRICDGTYYNFRGVSVSLPGFYYDSLKTVSGCDSIYKLKLIVEPCFYFEEKAVICDNEYYDFRGQLVNKAGIYYDSLKTQFGCDSIYVLNLSVNKTYLMEEIVSICDYEKYYFRGTTYNQSGVYWDSLVTSVGCDSIYKLDLRVTPTFRDTIIDTICLGEQYNFRGHMLSQEGEYVDTLYNPATDSCEVVHLHLYTKSSTVITEVKTNDVCADDVIYEIYYKYHGSAPISYSIYYDDVAQTYGFKNVINRPFSEVIVDTIPQLYDDYIRPDYYNVRLEFNNGICDPSVNGYDFKLLVKYPSWIMEQNWNDVVAILNDSYNGGYLFDKYEWYVNDRLLDIYKGANLYLNDIHIGDKVFVVLTRSGENYSIPTCLIEIEDKSNNEITNYPILVSTSSNRQNMRSVNLNAGDRGSYVLYDILGHVIFSGEFSGGDNIDLVLPDMCGFYLLYLFTEQYGHRCVKLL